MIKRFGANLFLFSILLGLILLPITSLKLLGVQQQEVLSSGDIREQYLRQRIEEQEQKILDLESQLQEIKETTISEEILAE